MYRHRRRVSPEIESCFALVAMTHWRPVIKGLTVGACVNTPDPLRCANPLVVMLIVPGEKLMAKSIFIINNTISKINTKRV